MPPWHRTRHSSFSDPGAWARALAGWTLPLLAGAAVLVAGLQAAWARCALDAGPARAVTQVVDGETLKLDDGSTVRLAGIITPRAPDSASELSVWAPGDEARAALEKLVLGQSVDITFAGPRGDRYGRTLAQVFMTSNNKRVWVQGEMLSSGHARSFGLIGATDCQDELLSHERLAFQAQTGLWANAAYQVRSADSTLELMRYRHTLQLVEGVVAEVAEAKGRVYLNFGSDWRTDFTAGIEKGKDADWSRVFDFKSLKGERVRVRGFIERRNGPFVELTHPSQLEVIQPDPEPAPVSRRSRRRSSPQEPQSPAQ